MRHPNISKTSDRSGLSNISSRAARTLGDEAEALAVADSLANESVTESAHRDRHRLAPWSALDRFSASGLWASTVPARYGGTDISYSTLTEVIARIATGDASIAQIPLCHWYFVERLKREGTERQKEKYFAQISAGARVGNANAEPGDRSPNDQATSLTPDGHGIFLLTGNKVYTTGSLYADLIYVGARDATNEKVIVVVRADAPGVHIYDDWDGFGQRTTASGRIRFESVVVEEDAVIRDSVGSADADLVSAANHLMHSALEVGIARNAFADAIDHLKNHASPARGSAVAEPYRDPLALAEIGRLHLQQRAAELILAAAAKTADRASAEPTLTPATTALLAAIESKVVTAELALSVTSKLFDLAGAAATTERLGLDRHWRNSRTHTLHDVARWKLHALGNYRTNGALPDPWTLAHPYSENR